MKSFRSYLSDRAIVAARKAQEFRAERAMRDHQDLQRVLDDYSRASTSTGCNVPDYWHLYRSIRSTRPVEVLECGTGVSTIVIAHALMENERITGKPGRITSMEEHAKWADMARGLLPERYAPYVDIVQSPTMEDYFSLFRGVRYRDIPARPYDFVFVDGPSYRSPIDGTPTFDLDFLHVLQRSDTPIAGLIDQRVSTCFVLQQVLGPRAVRYYASLGLGFIQPVTRANMGRLPAVVSAATFRPSFRAIGPSRLAMYPLEATSAEGPRRGAATDSTDYV